MFTIMKKTYENPLLQVVSIKKNDIVCSSPVTMDFNAAAISGNEVGAAGRRYNVFDEWYEGY